MDLIFHVVLSMGQQTVLSLILLKSLSYFYQGRISQILNGLLKSYKATIHFVCLETKIQKLSVLWRNSETTNFRKFDNTRKIENSARKCLIYMIINET